MPQPLTPEPLLDAFGGFTGTLCDCEQRVVVLGSELARWRGALAAALRAQGIVPGDRVALAVGNGPGFLLALAGALEAGASPLLLHAETPHEELLRVSARWDVGHALVDRPVGGGRVLELGPWASFSLLALAAGDRAPGATPASELPRLPGVPLHPTSGTTGVPKLAVRPAAAALAEAAHYIDAIGISADDHLLCVAPMSHAYAFGTCAMVPLVSGCSVTSMRTFNPRLVDRALEEQGITVFFAVPAMLDLLARRRTPLRRHPALRVYSAGAPLPAEVAERFAQAYQVEPRPLYGTTETGGISVASTRLGRAEVGPAMRGVEVWLGAAQDAELGAHLGRLWVRSSSMMAGYLTASGVDDASLVEGAFDTGDLASLDAGTGVITLHGRQSDVINVFGMKVIPSEVEDVLRTLPCVGEVIVYAGKHRSGSQIVQAAVVAADSTLEVSALRAHCERHLAPYKRPQLFHVLPQLPRTASGKVLRAELP